MRRGEENREGSPVLLPSLTTTHTGPPPTVGLLTPKPSNATNAVWAGSYDPFGACFGLNSVNYPPPPPPLPGGIPAVCRLHSLRRQYLYPTRCEKVVLCATVPSASFSSAPNLRRAERSPPPISPRVGSCTCMGTRRRRSMWSTSKKASAEPPTRTSKLLASSRRGKKLCSIEGYFPPWKTKR